MNNERTTLIARLRQLQAADRNAVAIYTELSKSTDDETLRNVFSGIASDEKRHVALGQEILSLLEK
jgi:rubrerythrin